MQTRRNVEKIVFVCFCIYHYCYLAKRGYVCLFHGLFVCLCVRGVVLLSRAGNGSRKCYPVALEFSGYFHVCKDARFIGFRADREGGGSPRPHGEGIHYFNSSCYLVNDNRDIKKQKEPVVKFFKISGIFRKINKKTCFLCPF